MPRELPDLQDARTHADRHVGRADHAHEQVARAGRQLVGDGDAVDQRPQRDVQLRRDATTAQADLDVGAHDLGVRQRRVAQQKLQASAGTSTPPSSRASQARRGVVQDESEQHDAGRGKAGEQQRLPSVVVGRPR